MSVTLTVSKGLSGTSKIPGIKAVGIAAWNSTTLVKTATGVIDLVTSYGAGTIARMEVKNTTINYVENGISGGDSRSQGVTGNLPVVLSVPPGADVEYAAIVEQLLKGEVCLFIERKDGKIYAAGSQLGAQAVTADDQTGGTIGDLDGFTVTFQTMEPDFSRGYLLTGSAVTEYATALLAVG
jgi:hypothetical protein